MSREETMFREDTQPTRNGDSSLVNILLISSLIQSPNAFKFFSASSVKILSIDVAPATIVSGELLKVPPCDIAPSSLASNLLSYMLISIVTCSLTYIAVCNNSEKEVHTSS